MTTTVELCEMIRSGRNDDLEHAIQETPSLAGAMTDQGISVLMYAVYCRNDGAVQLLRRRKSDLDVFEAASVGDLAALRLHVLQHPDLLGTFSQDGFTLLGLACFFNHEEVARYLTENGADVNTPSSNSFKVTPLHSACAVSSFTIAEMLLSHGADPNVRQQAGFTPLHEAAQNGKSELVRLLVAFGADVNAKLDDGRTPVQLATEKSFDDIAAFLRKHGGM
jgi:ankyrin repeat protein